MKKLVIGAVAGTMALVGGAVGFWLWKKNKDDDGAVIDLSEINNDEEEVETEGDDVEENNEQ